MRNTRKCRVLCLVCMCALLAVGGGISFFALAGDQKTYTSGLGVANNTLHVPENGKYILVAGDQDLGSLSGFTMRNVSFTYRDTQSGGAVTPFIIPSQIIVSGLTMPGDDTILSFGAMGYPYSEGDSASSSGGSGSDAMGTIGGMQNSRLLIPARMFSMSGKDLESEGWTIVHRSALPYFSKIKVYGTLLLIGDGTQDFDRIEVLRNGQATLFGANAGTLYSGFSAAALALGGKYNRQFAANSSIIVNYDSIVDAASTRHRAMILGALSIEAG